MKSFPKRGEIYWADLPNGLVNVHSGSRPVLVISNNIGNKNSPVVIVAPLTTKSHHGNLPTRVLVVNHRPRVQRGVDVLKLIQSSIMFEQIMTINKSCLIEKMGCVKMDEALEFALKNSIGLGC